MTYRTAAASVSGGAAVTVAPMGVQAGDSGLAFVQTSSSAAPTAPSGWTPVSYGSSYVAVGDGTFWWSFARTATASEPASYTFTAASGQTVVSAAVRFGYGEQFGGLSGAYATSSGTGGSVYLNGPSLSSGESAVFAVLDSGGTLTFPGGITSRVTANNSGNTLWVGVGDTTTSGYSQSVSLIANQNVAVFVAHMTAITAPLAPTPTAPANNSAVDLTSVTNFLIPISDADPSDTAIQSQIRWRPNSTTAWTTVTSTASNPTAVTTPANTFAAGQVEWQANSTDVHGNTSPWSGSMFFTAGVPPTAPPISAPTANQLIQLASTTLSWTPPANQQAYRYLRVADGSSTVYYDSGVIPDSAQTSSVTVALPINGHFEHLQLLVEVAGLWSPVSDVRIQVQYATPPTPVVTLANQGEDITTDGLTTAPGIQVQWTIAAPNGSQVAPVSVNVYRQNVQSVEIRVATGLSPTRTFWTDYWYSSGVDEHYRVEAVAPSGATASALDGAVGSPYDPTTTIIDGGGP